MTTVGSLKRRPTAGWPLRHWIVAVGSAIAYMALVAIPTDLIDTPAFTREIAPAWWSWPALVVSAVLAGLLTATYVAIPEAGPSRKDHRVKTGYIGGILTFFAVGCPVCNKLVLLALGASGAMTWFAPTQPVLSIAAIGILAWALRTRLREQSGCRVRSLS